MSEPTLQQMRKGIRSYYAQKIKNRLNGQQPSDEVSKNIAAFMAWVSMKYDTPEMIIPKWKKIQELKLSA